jgi:hypothetical protein
MSTLKIGDRVILDTSEAHLKAWRGLPGVVVPDATPEWIARLGRAADPGTEYAYVELEEGEARPDGFDGGFNWPVRDLVPVSTLVE